MFRNVSCVSTGTTRLLRWEPADGFTIFKCRVYGTREGQEWVLIQDNITTDFLYLEDSPASTFDIYRLEGFSTSGDQCVIDNIPADYMGDKAHRVIREFRRRENVLYKAQPYGAPEVMLYLRKRFGEPCPNCDPGCPTSGSDIFCKTCYGTGIVGGYFKYPKPVRMLMVSPHAPKQQGTDYNEVDVPTQTFRTTFGGILRSHDLIRAGSELYDVVRAETIASVANTPVVYMLNTAQILPEDIRYKTMWNITSK